MNAGSSAEKGHSRTRILVLCTGNSCRSQMAEAFLRSFDASLDVASAGTHPASAVHPYAVAVMQELGIDLRGHHPKSVDQFLRESFDYVITVCDGAKETCPAFAGRVQHRLHLGFEDPALASGTDEEIRSEFCRIRDQIRDRFREFVSTLQRP